MRDLHQHITSLGDDWRPFFVPKLAEKADVPVDNGQRDETSRHRAGMAAMVAIMKGRTKEPRVAGRCSYNESPEAEIAKLRADRARLEHDVHALGKSQEHLVAELSKADKVVDDQSDVIKVLDEEVATLQEGRPVPGAIRRRNERISALLIMLSKVEWVGSTFVCPCCFQRKPEHNRGCQLAGELGRMRFKSGGIIASPNLHVATEETPGVGGTYGFRGFRAHYSGDEEDDA